MKKSLFTLLVALGATTTTAFGQAAKAPDAKTEAQIIALEKAGWEAWKNNDATWFQRNLTDDYVGATASGLWDKAKVVSATPKGCAVKSFALANFKVVMLDANVALLTYTATQDGVCEGKAIPDKVRAMVNYVKRGGKWLEASYMEKPME